MHPLPRSVGLRDVELDERAGIMLGLPRRGLFARAQPDDGVADSRRLAGLQRQVARLAVALVEQAEHGDAVLHRRRACLRVAGIARHVDRLHPARDIGFVERRRGSGRHGDRRLRLLPLIPVIPGPARRSRASQCSDDADHAAPVHASGVQAS